MLSIGLITIALIGATNAVGTPDVLGVGSHRYAWESGWLKTPADFELGNTHGGLAVDSNGRLYVNTDSAHAVCVFDSSGKLVDSFGDDLAGGLHGMALAREGDTEVLYLTHTGRHEALKTTLEGEVIWRLGYPEESGHYANEGEYRPTAIARAPDGRLFVGDGYGKSWVHRYDAERGYLGSFGGHGEEPGKMRTPHGLLIDERGDEPTLIVADRENNRLQVFDLDGQLLLVVSGMLRRPCQLARHGDDLAVADLAGRVTILGRDFRMIAQLGENPDQSAWANNGYPKGKWRDGEFVAPHSCAFDPNGNLYVMDWLRLGRVSKLRRLGDR